jgi:hypothetical protein
MDPPAAQRLGDHDNQIAALDLLAGSDSHALHHPTDRGW